MREAREQNMFETRGLPGNSGCDGGVRVPVQVNPPGRDRVENPPAVPSFEEHAFRASNVDRRGISALVCERMPQMQVGSAHVLMKLKRGTIEILLKYFE